MDRASLAAFLKSHRWAVASTVAHNGMPQAAVIGVAATDSLELVFDTLATTRKAANLRANPHIALVIGGLDGEERTVQYEGVADFPAGAELEELKRVYFAAFPDGIARLRWPGILYVRVKPRWLRVSDFNADPPVILEFPFAGGI
ncbi:MAG: pyridoxamine 5'-phosphate oxidase family protein [Betaproteobacteria bacterium]